MKLDKTKLKQIISEEIEVFKNKKRSESILESLNLNEGKSDKIKSKQLEKDDNVWNGRSIIKLEESKKFLNQKMNLSQAEVNKIFNNLPTVTVQKIQYVYHKDLKPKLDQKIWSELASNVSSLVGDKK